MARKGRVARGLLPKQDASGKRVWYVRLWHERKERRFGSFKTKSEARDFYEKAKQEQKAGQFFPSGVSARRHSRSRRSWMTTWRRPLGSAVRRERDFARWGATGSRASVPLLSSFEALRRRGSSR